MTPLNEFTEHDGLGLAELVRAKKVTAAELVEASIAQIEALNPQVNAVIERLFDSARDDARQVDFEAPFCGVPFLIKDLLMPLAGARMRNGTRLLRDHVPDHNGELAERYKRAGVIVLGKTNVPEFGYLPVTEPVAFGATVTPWAVDRTAGGSSGGAAAAVAARMVPLAHAGDGGGSIRVPASCCGLFGIKPTRGRNPLGPDLGQAWQGCAVDHVISRSVRDSAAMLDATAGPDIGALYRPTTPNRSFLDEAGHPAGNLRIAFTSKPFLAETVHRDCVDSLQHTIRLCEGLGHEVCEDAPDFDGEPFVDAFMTMIIAEVCADIERSERLSGRRARYREFEVGTQLLRLLGKRIRANRLIEAMDTIHRSARGIGRFFENYDVLITPTLAKPPLPVGSLAVTGLEGILLKLVTHIRSSRLASALVDIDKVSSDVFAFAPYTAPFNATGQPAMSVPLYWNADGLPIGVQCVGRYGDEATLFRLASQLEEAQPWDSRLPPIL